MLATTSTAFGVNSKAVANSTSIGVGAGQFSSGTVGGNTFVGLNAGKGTSASVLNSGYNNTFIGSNAGWQNNTGIGNTFIGSRTGEGHVTGNFNTFIGVGGIHPLNSSNNICIGKGAGAETIGNNNVLIGEAASFENTNSNENTIIGHQSGVYSNGSRNVFLGFGSGYGVQGNDKLDINNVQNGVPLISGDFALDQIRLIGKTAVGTGAFIFPTLSGSVNNVANYNLFVKGGILTEEIRVSLAATWADYVFSKDYKMPTLPELEKQIQEKGHLPNMPSAQEVKENGIELGEMAKMQQEKIEELTLYAIQQQKDIEELKVLVKSLINKK